MHPFSLRSLICFELGKLAIIVYVLLVISHKLENYTNELLLQDKSSLFFQWCIEFKAITTLQPHSSSILDVINTFEYCFLHCFAYYLEKKIVNSFIYLSDLSVAQLLFC